MVLYVGNLSFNVSGGDLGDIFSEFGRVLSANVNGTLVEGRDLRVSEAKLR